MAQHHHVLDLPEVLSRIGRHLGSRNDVVACSLVCKSFYASFEPYLWMDIYLERSSFKGSTHGRAGFRDRDPLATTIYLESRDVKGQRTWEDKILQNFQRIAPSIRALTVQTHSFPRQWRFGDRCNRINTLWITGIPCDKWFDETYWSECESLLKQNLASLQSLTLLKWGRVNSQDQPLWKPLSACSQHINLTTLRIRDSKILKRDLEALWRICRQLEILELTRVNMEDISNWSSGFSSSAMNHSHNSPSQAGHDLALEGQVSTSVTHNLPYEASTTLATVITTTTITSMRLPKLRELIMDHVFLDPVQQLEEFVLQCPLLQVLIWNTQQSESSVMRFSDNFAAHTWPYLDWIELSMGDRFTTEQEHENLLRVSPRPFRRLELNLRPFKYQTFDLYRERCHFTTLTKMDLSPSSPDWEWARPRSPVITLISKRVQEVLESCPMLEYITAMAITSQDITQGKPWVCHRLKMFEVMIHVELVGERHVQEGTRRGRIKYTKAYRTLCHQIFERLGQLKQLVVLDMRLYGQGGTIYMKNEFLALPLRLSMGLGHLSGLRKLELIAHHRSQQIRLADMEWMLQHWENFRWITGAGLLLKLSKTLEGVADEHSRLVVETLRHRQKSDLTYEPSYRRMTILAQEIRIGYCSETESEDESGAEFGGTE
ncbi:hypothetical protein B0O80DRAFT_488238 [Mortierella sp. GBAus27b]|nr:hypothetical protein B0O80DRAFT_488238 [Mortierella sp. GBAus27b]